MPKICLMRVKCVKLLETINDKSNQSCFSGQESISELALVIDGRVRRIDAAITQSREITPNSIRANQSVSNHFLTPFKGFNFRLPDSNITFVQSKSRKYSDCKNSSKDDDESRKFSQTDNCHTTQLDDGESHTVHETIYSTPNYQQMFDHEGAQFSSTLLPDDADEPSDLSLRKKSAFESSKKLHNKKRQQEQNKPLRHSKQTISKLSKPKKSILTMRKSNLCRVNYIDTD